MKSTRRFMAVLLCGALLTGVLAGCGRRSANGGSGSAEGSGASGESGSAGSGGSAQSGSGSAESSSAGAGGESGSAESSAGAGGGKEPAESGSAAEAALAVPDVEIKPFEVPDTEALRFAGSLKIGWNLGNTLDAYRDGQPGNELDIESYWCGIATTKEMIEDIKAAGFNSVRVPVSWHNHVDGEHRISEAWLNRVQEVVDYVYDSGMYVILNIHHDNSESFLYPDSAHLEQSLKYVTVIWEQLGKRFADYGDHLIFEAMNEPRLVGSQYEWWLNAGAEECMDAVSCINRLNQAFVDTVRGSGGRNRERYLMVPGYCASPDGALNDSFALPADAEGVEGKLMISVHAYTPYKFALQPESESGSTAKFDADSSASTAEISGFMDKLYKKYISNGIPVIIGEFGARDKGGNTQARIDYAAYYIAAARARGMSCFWWDNHGFTGNGELFGLYDRRGREIRYPEIVAALMKYAE